jgi:hypothetical protein
VSRPIGFTSLGSQAIGDAPGIDGNGVASGFESAPV